MTTLNHIVIRKGESPNLIDFKSKLAAKYGWKVIESYCTYKNRRKKE